MIINTKFNIDDTVYFMRDNQVVSHIVHAIFFSSYKPDSQRITYRLSFYKGNYVDLEEELLFASKQELLDNL